jgi:GNAT superfamily N-acetyltransferase
MKMPDIEIVMEDPRPEDCAAIVKALVDYNDKHKGTIEDKPDFAILVRHPDTKDVLGGLYGVDGYGWAFIKYLVVPEQYRGTGLGSRLIQQAETIAKSRGYIGIWLDTFEFQAKPFYEKLGYTVFGELEGGPNAVPRFFLKKRFI